MEKFCGSCGTKMDITAQYCPACGNACEKADLQEETLPKVQEKTNGHKRFWQYLFWIVVVLSAVLMLIQLIIGGHFISYRHITGCAFTLWLIHRKIKG